ncbi:MAG: glutathione S-transferase [Hyphomicrobiales bacterium]
MSDQPALDAHDHPVLYSFRRCPYAMRGRMGVFASGIKVEYREIILRDKPDHMVAISPKATVPVLQLPDGRVIDESLDIMLWALDKNDPDDWLLNDDLLAVMKAEIEEADSTFKRHLDHYKYPNKYPDQDAIENREAGLACLKVWDQRLSKQAHLFADQVRLADVALFPFVRQYANVDREWFDAAPIPNVQRWLAYHLTSDMFAAIMPKRKPWAPNHALTLFPFIEDVT